MKTPKNQLMLEGFVKDFLAGKEDLMIDVMAKKITGSKRQILYIFYILLRYLRIKENPKSQSSLGKVIYILSGRSSPQLKEDKKGIELIYKVMDLINNDQSANGFMKVIFVPNFSVAVCELFVSAADLSQHISTPGTEVSIL